MPAISVSSPPAAGQQISNSGLSCSSASGMSCGAEIHVQCAAMPARRNKLFSASTGSRVALCTISGTAVVSFKSAVLPAREKF
jgi:hypothetical protein